MTNFLPQLLLRFLICEDGSFDNTKEILCHLVKHTHETHSKQGAKGYSQPQRRNDALEAP